MPRDEVSAYSAPLRSAVAAGEGRGVSPTTGGRDEPAVGWVHRARIAQGADTLHKHAIEGFQGNAGIMPAKGGNPALTDEQVIATVQWMVDNLQ